MADPRLATFDRNGYALLDVAERNRIAPTFEIPSAIDRLNLTRDCLVKLVFLFPPSILAAHPDFEHDGKIVKHPDAERMWVHYRKTDLATGLYCGELRNQPALFSPHVLKLDDPVFFSAEHIAAIDRS